jgi:hypothetical protein
VYVYFFRIFLKVSPFCVVASSGVSCRCVSLRVPQERNNISVSATCHLIACVFFNPKLTKLKLDHTPSACVADHSWRGAGLPEPPFEAVRQGMIDTAKGWAAVLKALRVRHVCARS